MSRPFPDYRREEVVFKPCARVCGHSFEGEECADEMDGGGEADVGFVIAGGDATELLEIAEEVLDQVAPAIDREVAGDRADAVGLGRDDGRRPSVVQVGADPVEFIPI